jgi:type I restriction enzyme, S subunit
VALLGEREAAVRDRLLQISTDDAVEDLERPWLSGYCGDWSVQRLSYYLTSSPCYGVLKPDNYEGDNAVPIIRIKDINDGKLRLEDIVTISPEQSREYSRTILECGDVVLSVVGTIGKVITVGEDAEGMNLTRALARVQLSDGLSADFFKLVVGSRWFTEYVSVTTQGSAQKVLNMDDLRAWRFPVPTKDEQDTVFERYTVQSASLVEAQKKTNASIDRLKEYRSALITAAVTGQIDVTTYAKSGTPDRRLDAIQEEMGA